MIRLHHLVIGRSVFTAWLLEELELDYEIEVYHRDPQTRRAPPELRDVHPLGKSPVIEDDGRVVAESGAIASYLLHRYDAEHRLWPRPEDTDRWVAFLQWLHYPEGSAFAPLLLRMLLRFGVAPSGETLEAWVDAEVALQLGYISTSLGERPFMLGDDFSAVDVGLGYICSLARRLEVLEPHESLSGYLDRLLARPAFRKAEERTGG